MCRFINTYSAISLYIHSIGPILVCLLCVGSCRPRKVSPKMDSASLHRLAAASPQWLVVWERVESVFRDALGVAGLDDPLVWAGIRGDRQAVGAILRAMNMLAGDEAENQQRLDTAVLLQQSARGVGAEWAERAAARSGHGEEREENASG